MWAAFHILVKHERSSAESVTGPTDTGTGELTEGVLKSD